MPLDTCYHCALPIPAGSHWQQVIDGQSRAFCCPACQTVAGIIHHNGLDNYYRLRDKPGNRPEHSDDDAHPFDNPEFQSQLVNTDAAQHCSARLAVEGLHCAACAWLIESRLQHRDGVLDAHVSLSDQSLWIHWKPGSQSLGRLARDVEQLGYRLSPWHPEALLQMQHRENRSSLQRMGVAGLAMMQTGMMAAALYAGDDGSMEARWRDLFRWVSLLFTLPVATWAAWPFYRNALAGLRERTATMDLPVSLAIAGAFLASVIGTLWHSEHVYFDSVAMFTFLLLAGRHLEMRLRHRNRQHSLIRSSTLPWQAHRVEDSGHTSTVPAISLSAGDRVQVLPGEAIPLDGIIESGQSSISEAVLTGESLPQSRGPGDHVLAGTINHDQILVLRATTRQQQSRVALMQQHLQQALSSKPATVQMADRLSSVFVIVVIACAALTAFYWWDTGADAAMAATLAVLVASCPCALSLATPTAMSAATYALAQRGVLITRAHVLETLPRIRRALFDKTGTLTHGDLRVHAVHTCDDHNAETCLRIAAALERDSNHPVAHAFVHEDAPLASDCQQHPGMGVSGIIDGIRYRLGHAGFLGSQAPDSDHHWTGLADAQHVLAWFALQDNLRDDAADTINRLRAQGISTGLLTGDPSLQGQRIAAALHMDSVQAGASPEDKQQAIRDEQSRGLQVMMVGDGVNDAAVLSTADVSFAMAGATPLARLQSDVLLMKDQLTLVLATLETAHRTRHIIRQNLVWAAAYNTSIIPLAAMGWVPPWLAAIGMTTSSLLVTLNAMRLMRSR